METEDARDENIASGNRTGSCIKKQRRESAGVAGGRKDVELVIEQQARGAAGEREHEALVEAACTRAGRVCRVCC